jgi:ketosteroid isomerase-like protein
MFHRAFFAGLILLFAATGQAAENEVRPDDSYFINLVAQTYVKPFREGDIDTWLASFNENAIAMHNRRPVDRGKAAIAEFGRAVQQYFEIKQFDVEVTDIRQSSQWVYTIGQYTSHFVNKSDGLAPFGVEQGKFLLLWEKQANGEWQIILDTGNSNGP